MENKYVELMDLSVGYDGNTLIHNICITIQRGEIITLVGPNGSGKSTILKSITKQLKILKGKVLFQGEDLKGMTYKKLASKMAVVLTDRKNPELMTCHDVVAMGRYPYTGRLGILTKEDEQKVREAMEIVHAFDLRERPFDAISDGQRQRILLARAICQEPDILILDEPTSFLDIRYKLDLLSILRDMAKKKNMTVIMSLHEIDLAQKIADRMICVKGDTIARYGLPEEMFQEDFIRDFYEMENGYYDPLFGSIELPKIQGVPEIFVLSSGGTGIPVYRTLQKKGIAFAAGILYENDVDYRLARLLATEVITEKPFQELSAFALKRAFQCVKECDKVYNAGITIGNYNSKIKLLLEEAQGLGKLISVPS